MNIKTTEDFLSQFDYNYDRNGSKIIIKMDYNHHIFMDFKDSEKIIIKDQLTTWNFITGPLKTSIRKGMIINTLCAITLSSIVGFFDLKSGILLFIIVTIWSSAWAVFHTSNYENLKYILINGNNFSAYSIES